MIYICLFQRDQIALLQKDFINLRCQLDNKCQEITSTRSQLQTDVEYWQGQCTNIQNENHKLRYVNETLEKSLEEQNKKMIEISTQKQETESNLLDLRNEMHFALKQAIVGEQTRIDLEQLQKEHLILGELLLKFQDRFSHSPTAKFKDGELQMLKDVYILESNCLNQQLISRTSIIDSLKARINDLENAISKHDEIYAEQKRMLKLVKEEYHQELNVSIISYYNKR